MSTSKIEILDKDEVIAVLLFTYQSDIYKGQLRVSGAKEKEVRAELDKKPSLYLLDIGPVAYGMAYPRTWSWIKAMARWMTTGRGAIGTSYRVINPPAQKLFKKTELPAGAIP